MSLAMIAMQPQTPIFCQQIAQQGQALVDKLQIVVGVPLITKLSLLGKNLFGAGLHRGRFGPAQTQLAPPLHTTCIGRIDIDELNLAAIPCGKQMGQNVAIVAIIK